MGGDLIRNGGYENGVLGNGSSVPEYPVTDTDYGCRWGGLKADYTFSFCGLL